MVPNGGWKIQLSGLKEETKTILGDIKCLVPLLFIEQEKSADQDESGHRIWVAEKEAADAMYKACVIWPQTPVAWSFCLSWTGS